MNIAKGLWIDQQKAVVVAITDRGEEIKVICSHVKTPLGGSAGRRSTTPCEAQRFPADDLREKGLTVCLNTYYDRVVSTLRDADEIVIFGPGKAKIDLLKQIENEDLSVQVARVEPAEEMTIPQIAAKVRRYFQDSRFDSAQGGRTE